MKSRLLLFLFLIPFLGMAQVSKLNFKEIEKNLSNPKSLYHNDRLVFKFKGYPKSLDSLEAQHLYYGRNFRKDLVSVTDDDFKSLANSFREGDFEECVKKGRALYARDPTNLDVILILLRAYDQLKKPNDFVHHLSQLRLLTDAIKNSGDGKSEKTAFVVNSVGDEYIFLNMLNVGKEYARNSVTYKDSVIDVWAKEDQKIYIKVLYLDF